METNNPLAAAVSSVAENISTNITASIQTFDAAPQSWYAMKAVGEEAEVRIYDVIGSFGVSAAKFTADLGRIKAKTISVRINTPGGDLFQGTAIHNALVEHPARIVVRVDGVAASAGSFVAMAGDEIRMANNSYMMIHNAMSGVMGGADDMRRQANLLEKMNGVIAGMYERRSGKSREHWLAAMDAETWYTAEEAVAAGLADAIDATAVKTSTAKASFDFTVYNKIPDPVRRIWGLPTETKPVSPVVAHAATVVESIQLKAPETSPRGEAQPVTLTEKPNMADTTITTPAQVPAAPVAGPVSQGETTQAQITRFNDDAKQNAVEHGKNVGRIEGRNQLMDEIRAIAAASPGRPQTALNAVLAGQNSATVKLIVDAEIATEARANQKAQEQELVIARLNADVSRMTELSAIGGHSGVPVNVFAPSASAPVSQPTGLEPQAQAELEWDSNPTIRSQNGGDAGKNKWVLFRNNQLSGNVRVLNRA